MNATRVEYWILVSGDAWQLVDPSEIREFEAQGFPPVVRVTPAHAVPAPSPVVSARHAYAAFHATNGGAEFAAWGDAQRLTFATAPLVRGTRSLGGGLIPLRNAGHLYR